MMISLDTQTLLFLIIILFIIQIFIMAYYVKNTVEFENTNMGRKILKRVQMQINNTFDKYMGTGGTLDENIDEHNIANIKMRKHDMDSLDDPIDNPTDQDNRKDNGTIDDDYESILN